MVSVCARKRKYNECLGYMTMQKEIADQSWLYYQAKALKYPETTRDYLTSGSCVFNNGGNNPRNKNETLTNDDKDIEMKSIKSDINWERINTIWINNAIHSEMTMYKLFKHLLPTSKRYKEDQGRMQLD